MSLAIASRLIGLCSTGPSMKGGKNRQSKLTKTGLYQNHIQDSTGANTKERILLPFVQDQNKPDGNQLR